MEQDQQKQTLEESSRPEAIGVTRAMHQSKVRGRKRERNKHGFLAALLVLAMVALVAGAAFLLKHYVVNELLPREQTVQPQELAPGASGAAIQPRTRRAGDARSARRGTGRRTGCGNAGGTRGGCARRRSYRTGRRHPGIRLRPHRFPPKRTPHRRSTSSFTANTPSSSTSRRTRSSPKRTRTRRSIRPR